LSTYKQLIYEQRCQIEALNKSEFTQRVYQHIWEIKEVVAELNATPRKTLGFKTPQELMYNRLAAQAA